MSHPIAIAPRLPFAAAVAAAQAHAAELSAVPGVLGVRPGLLQVGARLTNQPAVIVVTHPGEVPGVLPERLDGLPVQTRPITPYEMINGLPTFGQVEPGALLDGAPGVHYVPPDPAEVALTEHWVNNITCHVGPDAGWAALQPFLEAAQSTLTVAIYDFYAPYIIDVITALGYNPAAALNLIVDARDRDEHIDDTLRQAWAERLDYAPASTSGPGRLFKSAYHTKVAVRDSAAFWLSSGNWTPTSQPVIAPGAHNLYAKGNREWHVIIEDAALAQMFEKFIRYDIQQARLAGSEPPPPAPPDLLAPEDLFAPPLAMDQEQPFLPRTFAAQGEKIRVRPLLSPDNYAPTILELIQSAQHSLYLQFSYIRQPSLGLFDEIITAIAAKMQAGMDVRVLVGGFQEQAHSELLIGQRGWQPDMFRRQTSKLHNKGILVDGQVAVVGSHNWSSDGVLYNRDASLVFYSPEIATYYTQVFMFDWNHLSQPITQVQDALDGRLVPAPADGETPPGMVRIPWREWFEA
jgi:phosphatidylserine/phosphatidylglycerophosphate/cardiolipin synthase-like enzyme